MNVRNSSVLGEESEDDFDWEEVEVGQAAALDGVQPSASATPTNIQDYYGETRDKEEGPSEKPHLEITIKTLGKKGDPKKNERAIQLARERAIRLDCHKIHTVTLLMNAQVRNQWINDELLHARLMSLTPLPLQNAFAAIHKSRVPDPVQRGRLFESAITRLADWWASSFAIVPAGHITSRTFDDVQRTLPPSKPTPQDPDPKGKGKARAVDADADDDGNEDDDEERYGVRGERIRSAKSLMKHALMMRGTRDTSAQLFTALCRALGIPARLVVSLQSVPWQASVGKPKPAAKKKKKDADEDEDAKGKGKGKAKVDGAEDAEDDDDDMEAVDIPGSPAVSSTRGRSPLPGNGQRSDGATPTPSGKGKQKAAPVIRLRKSKGGPKSQSQRPRRESRPLIFRTPRRPTLTRAPPGERTPDPMTTAPVFWTEVFSRADARWLPVDPIRVIVNKRKAFDPTPNPHAGAAKADKRRAVRVENRMVYVMAFEEDGFARDVTPRYAREFGAKVAKVQQGGRGRREWWERICRMVRRPYRLQRDDVEDEELQANQMTEAMPTTMAGFKDHPLYVLERHLKRDEVVEPPVEIGKFRGESVYPRGNVLQLKTAENWMRQGRTVIAGAQPLKWVKQRAVTVNKKRAIELALADQRDRAAASAPTPDENGAFAVDVDGGNAGAGEGFAAEESVMQGMYAEHQTEVYKPPPVIDGKVPKNDFGNLDLYVPSMLPAGAVHIPYKGTAKIARQLGFDYAEAVTGFEFKKRRAFPVVTGIVVAAENESAVLEGYWEAEQDAEAKRRAKRQDQVIKRWTKLIHGLRIRQRLIEQYADRNASAAGASSATAATAADGRTTVEADNQQESGSQKPIAGGFLTGVDDVVQPYTLPRNFHEVVEHASMDRSALGELRKGAEIVPDVATENDVNVDGDEQGKEPLSLVNSESAVIEVDDDADGMEEVVVEPKPARTPRTMQELAEEAARRDASKNQPIDSEQELVLASLPSTAGAKSAANGGSTRASRNGTKSGTSTPRASTRGKSKTSAAPKNPPRRTRKRTRSQAEGSDSGLEEEGGEDAGPSPAKRSRSRAPPPPVAPSSRVLRTRKPKDASTVQEEKEIEAAYRRAIAD
ncbi:Rad4-domain-containing protein [Dichomitus squalens]|uniref:Rad4-domain-containing protein n=1 Tax=Dichomitus squalens TaxID=114155 RepID=A0A4Q9NXY0_9APHY|nr:Rad4-domain-containing protein [Dichomitus squalens]TBU54629.1 Rad4-domain-containing protein [Dichomitus squalens]